MKKSILFMLAAAAMVSCSESELIEKANGEGVDIALKSTTYDVSASTRAPFEGALSATNELKARVISVEGTDFTKPHADGTMTFAGVNAVTYDVGSIDAAKSKFPTGKEVSLFGLYPATGWDAVASTDAEYSFTFDGSQDVMAATQVLVKEADVDATPAKYETLTFNHLLTKLEVKLRGDAAAVDVFGNVQSIRLIGDATGTAKISNAISFDGADATDGKPTVVIPATEDALDCFVLTENATTKERTYSADKYQGQSYTLTSVADLQAYAMAAPVEAKAGVEAYFLEIKTDEETAKIGVPLKAQAGTNFSGSTAGRSFTITVYFKDTGHISAIAEVKPWVEEGESEIEVKPTPGA